MNSRTDKRENKSRWLEVAMAVIAVWVFGAMPTMAYTGVVVNVGEHTILAAGNKVLMDTVSAETNLATATGVLQGTMTGEFYKMKEWEAKYNKYLTTAEGYASALKAATHVYDDGVRILLILNKLRKAINDNPQGVVATMDMNNLYMETLTEMTSVFKLLKDAVAKGGPENMLTGKERSKTLWALEDKLSSFSKKLHSLYISIRHYRMVDVWNRATAGMIDRDNGALARQSLEAWQRAYVEIE